MGTGHHDPTDHFRTTQPHAGETFNDGYHWPGLVAMAVGVIALVACIAAAAYQRPEWLLLTGLVAVAAFAFGGVWCAVEHRRVCRIDSRWHAAHSERLSDLPSTSVAKST
jgi:protein-S-isoprenylcysteine O-methyltransferase Ste14